MPPLEAWTWEGPPSAAGLGQPRPPTGLNPASSSLAEAGCTPTGHLIHWVDACVSATSSIGWMPPTGVAGRGTNKLIPRPDESRSAGSYACRHDIPAGEPLIEVRGPAAQPARG